MAAMTLLSVFCGFLMICCPIYPEDGKKDTFRVSNEDTEVKGILPRHRRYKPVGSSGPGEGSCLNEARGLFVVNDLHGLPEENPEKSS